MGYYFHTVLQVVKLFGNGPKVIKSAMVAHVYK